MAGYGFASNPPYELGYVRCLKDVDGRDKPGHDECWERKLWRGEHADCPTGKSVDWLSSPLRKNLMLSPSGKSSLQVRPIPSHRGAYPDRQRRGAGCGGRGSVRRET
jgi:hypothetical protein